MKQPTNQILYRYWNDLRGQRLAPTRFEIEPSRMAQVLSETFILERGLTGAFPFRLAGTRVCEQIGRELRGEDFLRLVADDRRVIAKAMAAVTMEGAALVLDIEAETGDGRTVAFEAIVLPLAHPATEVTRYMGAISAIEPPAWLGVEPITATWLVAHDIVWPEGRPYSFGAEDDRQLPFSPGLAAARIVKSARRQFRILDGGRK